MSSDAENRASAILLPGQEMPVEENDSPPIPLGASLAAGRSPEWFPNTSINNSYMEPVATSFIENESARTQLQSFNWPAFANSGPISYLLANDIIPGTLRLTVTYDVGIVEELAEREMETPFSFIPRFESPNFTAEMDYVTGMLTIIRTDLSILQIQAQYQTRLPGEIF